MTTPLRDALDDLVAHVPAHIPAAALVERAQRRGAVLRRRRRARGALVTVLAVMVLVSLAGSLAGVERVGPPAGRERAEGVGSYPVRVNHPWLLRDLPAAPGPLAALLEVDSGWLAVSPSGRIWRVPGYPRHLAEPTLSPDGRTLGYLAADHGPYVLRDLLTGDERRFEDVSGPGSPWQASPQTPVFWSPDSTTVLLNATSHTQTTADRLLASTDGGEATVAESAQHAGFVGAHLALWRAAPADVEQPVATAVWVDIETVAGAPVRRIGLIPSTPWRGRPHGQWGASVSPDGTHVALLIRLAGTFDEYALRTFSLDDGRETGAAFTFDGRSTCPLTWAGDEPLVAVDGGRLVSASGGAAATVTSPRLGTRCIQGATQAYAGEARGGWPFGTSTADWTWWWREVLLALGTAAAALLATRSWRRRRAVGRLAASRTSGLSAATDPPHRA